MSDLTFAQFTNALGDFFEQVSESMTDYLQNNYDTLSANPQQLMTFRAQRKSIHNLVDKLISLSDQAAFSAAKGLYASVKEATESMNSDISKIESADKWINFSAGLIDLGLAIISSNNSGIISSLQSIHIAISSKPPGDATAS